MPAGDGTGPMGTGPMNGRGGGFCGRGLRGAGRGMGMGRGMGAGQGFRNRPLASDNVANATNIQDQGELEALRSEVQELKNVIAQLKKEAD